MGSFDCYCAICGGPCSQVNINIRHDQSGESQVDGNHSSDANANTNDVDEPMPNDEFENDDKSDDEQSESSYEYDYGYNPKVIQLPDTAWTENCRVLGFNAAVQGVRKAFVSGPGSYASYGSMDCENGDDPNCQDLNIDNISCYYDFNHEDPVFPFHWDCFKLLSKRLTGSTDTTRIDKDVMFSVMRSLAPDYCQSLVLNYNEPNTNISVCNEQFWESRHGEEMLVMSPSQTSELDGLVRADVGHSFTLPTLNQGSIEKVKSDPFSKIPPEVLHEIISLLDHESLVGLLTASWPVHSACHDDNTFWKRRIKDSMAWFFELHSILSSTSDDSIVSMKALYLWAQKVTKPGTGLTGPYMALANRRRIWGACEQLADMYLPKLPKSDLGISEVLMNQAACPHMPVVSAPLSDEQNNEQAFWLHTWDEFYVPKTVETFWDSEGFLVGISVSINEQRRLFGTDDSHAGVTIQSFNLEKKVWIDGIILHIPHMDFELGPGHSWSFKLTKLSTSIRGITFRTSGGASIDLGQCSSGYCQRPYLSPRSHHIFGIMGQTGFIKKKPRIVRLGLLLIPTASTDDPSLRIQAPQPDTMERYLWTDQSCRIMGRPIWECGELNLRTLPDMPTQPPHNHFHIDTIPYEAFIWAHNREESRELNRITVDAYPSAACQTSTYGKEVIRGVCNFRADLNPAYNQDPILARTAEGTGKPLPEDESFSFEIDGAGGERIVEIALPRSDYAEAIKLHTNRGQIVTWQSHKAIGKEWRSIHIPETEIVVGLMLSFGDPRGYNTETESYTREHTRMTYLAALTIKE